MLYLYIFVQFWIKIVIFAIIINAEQSDCFFVTVICLKRWTNLNEIRYGDNSEKDTKQLLSGKLHNLIQREINHFFEIKS